LGRNQLSHSKPGYFTPGEELYITMRGWVGLKTGMDAYEKRENLVFLPGIEPQFLDHPACSTIIISIELTQFYITNERVKHFLHFNCGVR